MSNCNGRRAARYLLATTRDAFNKSADWSIGVSIQSIDPERPLRVIYFNGLSVERPYGTKHQNSARFAKNRGYSTANSGRVRALECALGHMTHDTAGLSRTLVHSGIPSYVATCPGD